MTVSELLFCEGFSVYIADSGGNDAHDAPWQTAHTPILQLILDILSVKVEQEAALSRGIINDGLLSIRPPLFFFLQEPAVPRGEMHTLGVAQGGKLGKRHRGAVAHTFPDGPTRMCHPLYGIDLQFFLLPRLCSLVPASGSINHTGN